MLGKVLVYIFGSSVQLISRLDSQSKLQMLTPFSSHRHKHDGSIPGWVNLLNTIRRISEVWENEEIQNLERCLYLSPITLQFLTLSTK